MEKMKLEELPSFAQKVLLQLPETKSQAVIVALQGDLGAGKTTFVQALARELGVTQTVQSPTYVLMKKYDISYRSFTSLIHIDAYRLNNPAEFAALKPENFLKDPQVLVCIEWPEKVLGALPEPDITLKLSLTPDVSNGAGTPQEDLPAQAGERYIEITTV
ncbi:tRNA (adenosine(37)-N6)-threonylcarbamoyltransferase complex ATPase subunit type 1 TsaE [Acetobacteraceae bacterium]|nr:tRNA (adenosine(37)-N6)-threonylcarbamoyltransferase complex ATPase subunit type 1 TsaE [Candidatus Parcubacteria bacterium]